MGASQHPYSCERFCSCSEIKVFDVVVFGRTVTIRASVLEAIISNDSNSWSRLSLNRHSLAISTEQSDVLSANALVVGLFGGYFGEVDSWSMSNWRRPYLLSESSIGHNCMVRDASGNRCQDQSVFGSWPGSFEAALPLDCVWGRYPGRGGRPVLLNSSCSGVSYLELMSLVQNEGVESLADRCRQSPAGAYSISVAIYLILERPH